MNKKGFLLGEETLKIVLAVIAIGFLVFFLVSLYSSYTGDKNLELAEASLKHLIEGINSGSGEVEVYNPNGWWLISWPSSGLIPNSCSNFGWNNCICICNRRDFGEAFQGQEGFRKSCEDSICLENSFSVEEEDNRIQIKNSLLMLTINYEEETITKKE